MEYTITRTETFITWLSRLEKADRQRLAARLNRLEGGSKDTQARDIRLAKEMLEE
jgi:putative component of toxin-antitoxin plasmid stabilization module